MFQNLRKKVNAVLPDIENMYLSSPTIAPSASSPNKVLNHLGLLIPSTSASSSTSSDHTKITSTQWPNSDAINFGAGCELLDRNEKIWEELHAANESNAKKAETCDEMISNLTESIKKRCIDLSDINISLEIIPNIVQTIENCSTIMIEINDKCTEVENQLFELEDLMELLQLQEKQLDRKFEMAMFKERKLANLEKVRQSLASKHADTVKESERQMRLLQQERQAVFQDAFQSDLKYYKEVGKIPKIEIEHKAVQQTLSLEEIVLDNDIENKELDKFLNE
ncbi:dysbindin protein homolog [Sitodiplosis mosellana]|uniref:dysbindin protein homolog n=1 Tax=Sitodiplosis mosellana TaxID=263140 RepID=UPI002443C24B|nr:dysbindin protein homolog [Sitodiplosis mosellana]